MSNSTACGNLQISELTPAEYNWLSNAINQVSACDFDSIGEVPPPTMAAAADQPASGITLDVPFPDGPKKKFIPQDENALYGFVSDEKPPEGKTLGDITLYPVDGEYFNLDNVIPVLQTFLQVFRPKGILSAEWSYQEGCAETSAGMMVITAHQVLSLTGNDILSFLVEKYLATGELPDILDSSKTT